MESHWESVKSNYKQEKTLIDSSSTWAKQDGESLRVRQDRVTKIERKLSLTLTKNLSSGMLKADESAWELMRSGQTRALEFELSWILILIWLGL